MIAALIASDEVAQIAADLDLTENSVIRIGITQLIALILGVLSIAGLIARIEYGMRDNRRRLKENKAEHDKQISALWIHCNRLTKETATKQTRIT